MIDYPGEVSTPTSDLKTMKIHIKAPYIRGQIKIHLYGRKIFLPEQPDGQGRIHHDSDFNDRSLWNPPSRKDIK